jgi:orotidine-5'-phosphate decarboxylase
MARLFCALDTTDLARARQWARDLASQVDGLKLGLEFFGAHGPAGVRAMAAEGAPLFLDLKLHDIPNTVGRAARAVAGLGPAFVTVHAAGGAAMIQAAREGLDEGARAAGVTRPNLLAITVLTSLADDDLTAVGQLGPVGAQVVRLAGLALANGADGVVCSAREAAALRAGLGPRALLVVPGIRPAASATQDQKRAVTPGDAVRLGADLLVVGRPITDAGDPAAAAAAIQDEMVQAA